MLQQTQVQTVIEYFNRFIMRFPKITDLAAACEDEVLSLWSGLGYYSRARYLHQTAKIITKEYQGQFPSQLSLLKALPGIGSSTAAAILSLAFNQATPILDGNVKRVLSRFFLISGDPSKAHVQSKLWELAQACMPKKDCAHYTQAIMDLGALCCTPKNPKCTLCPLQSQCLAYKNKEQEHYPNKKIKKQKPIHHQQFLVLSNLKGCIYLEKRPAKGVWGGLWCLPALEMTDCPLNYIQLHHNLKAQMPKPIAQLTHQFTHFTLKITALHINITSMIEENSPCQGRWFRKEQLMSVGLAKPTQCIINHIA